jgi:hypothetical protein
MRSLPLTTIESNSKYPLYLMFALFANWSSPWKTTPYLFARTAPNLVAIAESSRRRRSGVYGCLARFVFHHAEDSSFEENSCRWKETPAHRKEVCSLLEDAAPAKASLISFRRHKMQRWKREREALATVWGGVGVEAARGWPLTSRENSCCYCHLGGAGAVPIVIFQLQMCNQAPVYLFTLASALTVSPPLPSPAPAGGRI